MDEKEKGTGWLVFASIMLVIAGVYNFIWGIGALAKDDLYVVRFLFGNLTFWGWVWLIVGVIEVIAGFGVLTRNQAARWFGITMASISAIIAFFYVWAAPGWTLLVIALDLLVIYGLSVYGGREGIGS